LLSTADQDKTCRQAVRQIETPSCRKTTSQMSGQFLGYAAVASLCLAMAL
jgi:hypothetical protein